MYLSASLPKNEGAHLLNVGMDVLERYDVDGLNFDYVRYPSPVPRLLARLPRPLPPLAPAASLRPADRARFFCHAGKRSTGLRRLLPRPEYGDFRRAQITELVERIYFGVKKRNPNVIVSADVFPNAKDAYENRFQDWKLWLERGALDVLCPMAYAVDTDVWKRQIAVARGFAFGRQVWAGIGAYRQSAEATIEKIELSRRRWASTASRSSRTGRS